MCADFWNFSDDKTRASLVCSGVGKCYAAAPEYHFPEMCMVRVVVVVVAVAMLAIALW